MPPRPRLRIKAPGKRTWAYDDNRLKCTLCFGYEQHTVELGDAAAVVFAAEQRQLVHRDRGAERAALVRLRELGVRQTQNYYNEPAELRLAPKHLPALVRARRLRSGSL